MLFIASGYLTNGAKDWIVDYERSRPPFRIRVWETPQLRRLLVHHMDIALNHDVHTSTLRRVSEILAAQSELGDKLWYGRSSSPDEDVSHLDPKIVAGMRAAQRRMEEQYGINDLMSNVESDFAWGMLSGKVSALRWVLGEDWDMLDT